MNVRKSALLTILALALVLAVFTVAQPAAAAAPGDVVINEIMQNPNAVFDSAGEWFELYNATSAAIDIDGWTISDNDTDSHTISNGGPLLIPAGGYLVLGNNGDMATNGGAPVAYSYGSSWFLANGADEVILEDNTGTEIDRVEYDGGTIWPDPTGASMALSDPASDNNAGANWCTASTAFGAGDLGTPGAANDCETGGGLNPGDLVINEIMQNPNAVFDSAGEWFEVYNNTAGPVDLEGLTVSDDDTDSFTIASPVVVASGGYAVLGNNADPATNGGLTVDYQYAGMFLSNGADEVVIFNDGVEIDRVNYDDGATFPDPTGASMALNNTANDNNAGANWCTASTPFGLGDFGTPGAANDCETGGGLNPGDLVINEIMQNPNAVFDSAGEWFEVYNNTAGPVDLMGLTVSDNDFDSFTIASSVVVASGGYAVLGNNNDSDTNGGVNVDYQYPSNFFLANGADEVVIFDDGVEIDRVNYDGGPTFPDPTGAAMALDDTANDNNAGANWCTASTPYGLGDFGTPGAANDCPLPPVIPDLGVCGDGLATPIHAIQGSDAASSPEVGAYHVIEGVVVGDFQGSSGLNGFFVQEEDADADGDPLSSEGIFVFDGGSGVDVANGDVVRVRGLVAEFFALTEITGVLDVVGCGYSGTASAAAVTFPLAAVSDLEDTEGMLVNIPQTLYVSGNFTQARYGEVDLSVGGPLNNPTNVVAPGAPANALQDLNDRSRIQLDDGSTIENPLPLPRYLGPDNTLRTGDTIPSLTAVLGYAFGVYELHPTGEVNFTRANARPGTPDVGGELKVAAYNVLNYFTTIDNAGSICGPQGNQGCRGADTADEFTRQRAKIVTAISTLGADVVGLMEIENAPDNTPEADLVAGLNAATAPGTYDYIATGAIGDDAIRVALLYQPAAVTPLGSFEVLDSSDNPLFDDARNRPMLVQSFVENGTGEVFTVAVNHLKSKGTPCTPDDPDTGDGQGNCNITRTNAAQAIVDFLATDPTGSGDGDFLIIGDLNSYAQEDPIVVLETGGYVDLIESFVGSGFGDGAYSFNFFSQSGYLDHGLASGSMAQQVTGANFWHVNADEPSGLDYNNFNQPLLYKPDAFRSSDHDPVVIGLNLADPMGDKEDVVAGLAALLPTGDKNTDKRLSKAIESIEESLDPAWWTSDQTITDKKVFDGERAAVTQLSLIVASGVPEADAAMAAIDVLLNADRQLAQIELIAAIARGGDALKIADAEYAMAEAAAFIDLGLYNDAINAYEAAWDAATKA